MALKLYNTFTRKKDIFKPLKDKRVSFYTCGPTIYGPAHLGHLRSYVSFDLLKRVLINNSYQIKHILNITDIHDDMFKKAKESGLTVFELADKYIPLFLKDLGLLNILPADVYPRVTKNIKEIIEMIQVLLDKGFAYVEKDGSVYFQIAKFKKYGQLSGIKLEQSKAGLRTASDKYQKKQRFDFALWKAAKPGEPSWDSPWGKGRPGWHIECSVMSRKYLSETIDIHGGGMDLKFPHHENEIAQSESASGKKFVNYWFHAGALRLDGRKMSKSLNNYIELQEIIRRHFSPLALRYLFLTAHYHSSLDFTWLGLEASQKALDNLYKAIAGYSDDGSIVKKYQNQFLTKINNDLDLPGALALAWQLVGDRKVSGADRKATLIEFDKIFGLDLAKVKRKKIVVPKEIRELIKKRERARQEKNWTEADRLRQEIEAKGYQLKDTEEGTKINIIRNP